jgi:beta-mannosidase
MNMIRVWGGGIYEPDLFYDLCDELGLLVWQDFMFACGLYPGREYRDLYAPEFIYQHRRLEHHPALALWCGNNEIELIPELLLSPMRLATYSFVFRKLIPTILRRGGSSLPYWCSSPHKPIRYARDSSKDSGDTHDWLVWHELKPLEHFQMTNHRFVSEFGMQSYPHPEVALTFCGSEDLNVFSRPMENHQKHAGGNARILEYLARRYPFPKDYAALSYLSQIHQAYAIRSGVEHWRTSMSGCRGTLFWQLNDCWPVASWSSIDFGGRWKALQYDARRFFAPVLVVAKLNGQVIAGKGNYYQNSISGAEIVVASDLVEQLEFELRLTIFHVSRSEALARTVQPDGVGYGEVTRVLSIDLSELMQTHGAANLLLRLEVTHEQELLSENTVLCDLPKFISWRKSPIEISIEPRSRRKFRIDLKSALPQYQVFLDLPGVKHELTDNFFEVWPDQVRSTELSLDCDLEVGALRERFKIFSIADAAV